MLIAAFILGFTGSLHCVGMCGPIAMMINGQGSRHILINRMVYNVGRVITYVLMGIVVGMLGKIVQWGDLQGKVSIALGLFIIILLLIPKIQSFILPSLSVLVIKLKRSFSTHLQSKKSYSTMLTGILNGFLPCGLVYAALAIALIQVTPAESATVMALFGLGTLPAMVAVAYSWQAIRKMIPFSFQRIQMAMLVIVAVGMILRGLSTETHLFHGHGPDIVCTTD